MSREIIATSIALATAILTYIIPPLVLGAMVQVLATAVLVYFVWQGWGGWIINQARQLFVRGESDGIEAQPESPSGVSIATEHRQFEQDRGGSSTG